MGDGIGGSIVAFLSNNAFEILITHHRKDNKEEYGKTERIIIAKIDKVHNMKKKLR
jgi:5,10-methylene-tetrahydrofolate dehydrogenase/methenyl tetrahydrofolate cyclohydrolase